jgi:hypothetical protein
MPRVALQQDKSQVIRLVVIEPSGSHDRVRMTAGPDHSLRTTPPVMGFGGAVVGAGARRQYPGRDSRGRLHHSGRSGRSDAGLRRPS